MQSKERKLLKKKGFFSKTCGPDGQKGLSDSLLSEIDHALETHELIKVRLTGIDKSDYTTTIDQICTKSSATAISRIGHVLTLYRAKQD